MKTILIVYESRTGHVEAMARAVAEGVKAGGAEPVLREFDRIEPSELPRYDGFAVGSFTSYGQMSAGMSRFFELSYTVHGRLQGKPAVAFASSGGLGGGNETTVLSLIKALLVHGMMVLGDADSPHFGAVCIEAPDQEALENCRKWGGRIAALVTTQP